MSVFRNAVACATAICFALALAQSGPPSPATAGVPTAPAPSFVTIGDKPAVSYDSPSQKGIRIAIYSRFHPLEVLVRIGGWTKVRDADGGVGWIETGALGTRRFVMVSVPVAQVRAQAAPMAPPVFEAERGVLLEITPGNRVEGWLPVAHRDGQAGYVAANQVWGG